MGIRIERIKRDLDIVNSFTATPGKGITRLTFSKEYMGARSYIVEELRNMGAHVSTAIGGSLRGRLDGSLKDGPVVMMGSHIDSVVRGGRFDGVVGVVSSLEAARVIVEEKIPHRHPIDVVVFAEEEGSRFSSVMIGSRAWTGKLSLQDLQELRDRDGISYIEAMKDSGIVADDPSILTPDHVKSMLELHIEQSVVLDRQGLQVGVVEGIAGIKQFLVTLHGMSNHAGGTPMGLRFDALQGAVRIIAEAEEMATHEMGKNTVATVGFLTCEPGLANIIPGRVQFTLDIRDIDPVVLEKATNRMIAVIQKICENRKLAYEIEKRSDTPPVILPEKMIRLLEGSVRERNIKPWRMMSGALHDSSIMAEITDVAMIFIPSKDGRSHCPEEFTELRDIEVGAEILLAMVSKLAN